jgi:tetratricopeptide (TPR) repeat protein
MSDPLRTDGARALDGAPDADRDAKIEQLLLSGLDQYFAGQYDQAINVWTRALFLDRSHPRARAYIERARSALAERQRQCEELLQNGVAAFHRGDADEARRLLQAAIDAGAPPEDALAFLERLNRLDSVRSRPTQSRPLGRRFALGGERTAGSRPARWAIGAISLVSVAAAAVAAFTYWNAIDWRSLAGWPQGPAPPVTPTVREMPPLPRRGETALARASVLAAGGHLRDALALLDAVRPTDPQKPAADRLRAEIQRQLIAIAAGTAPTGTGVADREDGQQP